MHKQSRCLAALAAVLLCCSMLQTITAQDNSLPDAELRASTGRQLQQYAQPVPIDSSVILLANSDVEGQYNSPCVQMVNKIKEFGGRAVNFVITKYYADYNNDNIMDELGYKETPQDSMRPITWEAAYRFSKGLSVSLAHHQTRQPCLCALACYAVPP
jgi:hypothetical protein